MTRIRSPDFFDAEQHPYVRFVSETATLDGERLHVQGLLYARGARIPLELDATLRPVGDDVEVEAVTAADHRRLGMTWNQMSLIRTPSKPMLKAGWCATPPDRGAGRGLRRRRPRRITSVTTASVDAS